MQKYLPLRVRRLEPDVGRELADPGGSLELPLSLAPRGKDGCGSAACCSGACSLSWPLPASGSSTGCFSGPLLGWPFALLERVLSEGWVAEDILGLCKPCR